MGNGWLEAPHFSHDEAIARKIGAYRRGAGFDTRPHDDIHDWRCMI